MGIENAVNQVDQNMTEAVKHLLFILRKTNIQSLKSIEKRVYQHTSKRGIVTEIRGYLTFEEYWRHKDEGELQRCNGFYFVLKRISSNKGV